MANVIGRERLMRKLKKLPDLIKTRARQAMELAADEIVSTMKTLVPEQSGALKASIGWTWGKAPKGSMTVASVSSSDRDMTITVYAGNDEAYYARWVEFGTSSHVNGGRFAGTANPGTKAQPFFFVSFRANRKRAKSRISRAITKAAKEIAAGR